MVCVEYGLCGMCGMCVLVDVWVVAGFGLDLCVVVPVAVMRVFLHHLRRSCGRLLGSPAHESPPADPSIQQRRMVEQRRRDL